MGRNYSKAEKEFLRNTIPGRTFGETAEMFNAQGWRQITSRKVAIFAQYNKIKCGVHHGKFQKGCKVGIPNLRRGYKKPLPLGATFTDTLGFVRIKVAQPNTWRRAHLHIWEQANGEIPAKHSVIFADGNKQNLSLENLMLVSVSQRMYMESNKLRRDNAELTRIGAVVAQLITTTKARERQGRR